MTQDRATKGRHDVMAGKRPDLKESVRRILGASTLHIDAIMEGLETNGWLPNSGNPRDYVSQTIAKAPDEFERVRRGVYRCKSPPSKARGSSTIALTVMIPRNYMRALTILGLVEKRSVSSIVTDVIEGTLGPRINNALDAMKIPEVKP